MTYMRWLCSLVIAAAAAGDDSLKKMSMDLFVDGSAYDGDFTSACMHAGVECAAGESIVGDRDALVAWFYALEPDAASKFVEHMFTNAYGWDIDDFIEFLDDSSPYDDSRCYTGIFFPDGIPSKANAAARGVELEDAEAADDDDDDDHDYGHDGDDYGDGEK